ncbi:response regulator [Vogesella sp. LIG4]|uniref:response regulator n=1 Tax=Vogesella sp. LIG4 TaxID=1192162 RepID=UPI00082001DF|nr:response regulator [Vogesella sp. LIG4]SCK24882.1 Response regulator containing a CheY-like receiver domain and an HTH DNA-binding domain [Vogesella sp. LIG4]
MRIFDTGILSIPTPASALRPARLFVIEDSDAVRAMWRSVVDSISGLFLVGEFNCAAAAIAAIRRVPPDVLLLDIHFNESEGMDVLRVVATEYPMTKIVLVSNCADQTHRRYAAEFPRAEVIVVSNCTDPTHRDFCTKAGAYTFCDKGRERVATRCLRCMQEALAEQLDHTPTLYRQVSTWRRAVNGYHH